MTKKDFNKDVLRIWHLLAEKKVLTIRKIEELTQTRDVIVFMALGCLVSEDKVQLTEKEGVVHVEITAPLTENYY